MKIFIYMGNSKKHEMPLTEENRDGLMVLFATSPVHIDEDGNEHYVVFAPLGRSTQGIKNRGEFIKKYGKEKLLTILNS